MGEPHPRVLSDVSTGRTRPPRALVAHVHVYTHLMIELVRHPAVNANPSTFYLKERHDYG